MYKILCTLQQALNKQFISVVFFSYILLKMSSVVRKKSGKPSTKEYSNPLMLHSLGCINGALREKFSGLLVDESIIAQRMMQLVDFMDVSCAYVVV